MLSGQTLKSALKSGTTKQNANTSGAQNSAAQDAAAISEQEMLGIKRNQVKKELSSVTEFFMAHEQKFKKANLLKKQSIELV